MKKISKIIIQRAKKIKLFAMDVDGVLTCGTLTILNNGEEIKTWNAKDGMGFTLLRYSQLPIQLAWITARKSKQVENRAKELKIPYLYQGCTKKWAQLQQCANQLKIKNNQIAYIGDDYVDQPCLKNVGLAICPPDSPEELKKNAHYITKTAGGKGAVREIIEILIRAQGKWKQTLSHFLILFIFCFSLFLTSCSKSISPESQVEYPDQWIEDFTITETSHGIPLWILNSDIAKVFNSKNKISLEEVRIQFMETDLENTRTAQTSLQKIKKEQQQRAYLTAPKGKVQIGNKNLHTWGGVEIHTNDGGILYTEELTYSNKKKKLLTNSPVRIVRGDSVVLGQGLEASPDLSVMKIFKHKASLHLKELDSQ